MAETTETVVFEVDVSSYEKSLAELTKSINTLKTSQKDLQEQTKQGAEGAAESLEKVNAELKVQQQQYRTTQNVLVGYLGAKQKEVNVTDFAKNSIQANRDLLKQLTAQYINTKSPSEQFTKQIKTLSDTLKQQEGVIGDTRRNVGNYFNEFAKGIPVLGQIIDPLKNIGGAFQNVGFSAAGFQAAFLAGIPLIIAGVQGLVSIMQKFDSVTEGLEDTMAGVNRSFDFFVAHGNDGSLTDLVNGMTDAYNAGVKLSQVMRELAEAEDIQRVTNASANKEIEALIIKSKDRTRTEQERIAFLDEASKREKKNLEENIALAEQRVGLAQQEFKRVLEAGLADDKAKKELNNANINLINLQRESGNLQEKILNRRNALLDEINQNEEKAAKERKAREDKANKDAEDAAVKYNNIQKLKLKAVEELDAANKKRLEDQIKLEEEAFNREQDALVKQAQITANRVGSENARVDAELIARQRLLQNEKLNAIERENIIRESEDRIQKIKEDSAAKQTATQEKLQKDQIAAVSGIVGNAVGVLSEISSALDADIKDKELALKDALANGTITQKKYAEESKKLKKKQFEETKAVAIVSAILQGVNATLAAYTSGAAIPIVGAVTGPLFAGLAAAFAAVQVGLVSAQQPPAGFAKGVIGLKGAGTGTSDSIDAKLSKGESVITARATERYHHILADMERSVGNTPNYNFSSRRFATGVIGIPTSDGGFSTREISNNVNNSLQLKQAIREGFAKAPAPELSIVELNTKQNSRSRSINISEL